MAPLIRPSLLARAQATLARGLTTPCTIQRTGQRTTCAVFVDQRIFRLNGLPEFVQLQRYRVMLPFGTDVQNGDHVVTVTPDTFLVIDAPSKAQTYTASASSFAVLLDASVPATTTRMSDVGAYTPHLDPVTCYVIDGALLQPISPQFMADTFNATTQQPSCVFASLPSDSETFPILPNDRLVVPGYGSYFVHGVNRWAPGHVVIFVDVPIE